MQKRSTELLRDVWTVESDPWEQSGHDAADAAAIGRIRSGARRKTGIPVLRALCVMVAESTTDRVGVRCLRLPERQACVGQVWVHLGQVRTT